MLFDWLVVGHVLNASPAHAAVSAEALAKADPPSFAKPPAPRLRQPSSYGGQEARHQDAVTGVDPDKAARFHIRVKGLRLLPHFLGHDWAFGRRTKRQK